MVPQSLSRLTRIRASTQRVIWTTGAIGLGAQQLGLDHAPKRLAEKVLNLWGRCITVKPKKASLKVAIADPAKAKRAKKGGAK